MNEKGHENFAEASSYKLVHLLMTIRHGDRSAIHDMPTSNMEGNGAQNIKNAAATHPPPNGPIMDPKAEAEREAEAGGGGGPRIDSKAKSGTTGLNHPVHGNKYLDVRALEYVMFMCMYVCGDVCVLRIYVFL